MKGKFEINAFDKNGDTYGAEDEFYPTLSSAATRAEELMKDRRVQSILLSAFGGNCLVIKWIRREGWIN